MRNINECCESHFLADVGVRLPAAIGGGPSPGVIGVHGDAVVAGRGGFRMVGGPVLVVGASSSIGPLE